MATPEGRIKTKIKKLLKTHEEAGLYYEMPVPSGYGKSGLDFYGCFCGRFFAIEAKAPSKSPTALQEMTLERIRRAGGVTFVIDGDAGLRQLFLWLTVASVMKTETRMLFS